MKRLFAFLLALCLALPLSASATRTRITSYTEAEWDAVNAFLGELDERVWSGGIDCLTPDERLLYIAMSYNGLMLSGGLGSVFAFMSPEEVADVPAALRFVGAQEHAAQFDDFIAQAHLSPALLHHLADLTLQLMPSFEEQNAAFIALDEEVALTSIIFCHSHTGE